MSPTRRDRASKRDSGVAPLPDMPVPTAIHEARLLFDALSERRERFAGLSGILDLIDALPGLATALEESERARVATSREVERGSVRIPRQEALRFRANFLRAARFLLRNDDKARKALGRLAKSHALPFLAGDMRRIAALAEEHSALFAAAHAGLPADLPAQARLLAKQLVRVPDRTTLERRNEAFRQLDRAVRELRAAGRFVLRNDPEALARIASGYRTEKNRRRRVKLGEKRAATRKAAGKSAV